MTHSTQPWTITVQKHVRFGIEYFLSTAERDSDGTTLEPDGELLIIQAPKTAEDAEASARRRIDAFVDLEASKRVTRYIPGGEL